jgi:lipopolysaccharide export system permease protein
MEEQTITAARAEFRRVPAGVVVALTKGSIQTKSLVGDSGVRIVSFEEHALALPMQGSGDLPQRSWRGVYELSAPQFFAQYFAARLDPRLLADWATEAAMRLGVPVTALGHTLLAMALGLRFGNVTGRRGVGGSWPIIALPAAHIGFLVALQTLIRADARLAILVAALALLEIALSYVVLARLNSAPEPRRLEYGVAPEPLERLAEPSA